MKNCKTEITEEQVRAALNFFRDGRTEESKNAYIDISERYDRQKRIEAFEEFKLSIELRNEYYEFMNSILPSILDVLNNYKETLSTNDGSIRKSLLKLLPIDDKISYYVRNDRTFEIYYSSGIFSESYVIYKYYDNCHEQPFAKIDFEAEYKKANDYLAEYNQAVENLSKHKVNVFFKDYLKKSNHIDKINF